MRERRHRLTAQLLQAAGPLSLEELAAAADLPLDAASAALDALVADGLVVVCTLGACQPALRFRWGARWREDAERRSRQAAAALGQRMAPLEGEHGDHFDILDPPAASFHDFVLSEYAPPPDKRWLVFVQCSIRRPFRTSPSHAAIRRAIAAATGADPADEAERCPAHVVVLASRMGPVPYELQDVYPASVRGSGLQHFGDALFTHCYPVLVQRLAEYLRVHGPRYQRVAGFGAGRYGHVLRAAGERAGVSFPVLPHPAGRRLVSLGASAARKYWERDWIQLYDQLLEWLDETERTRAEARLAALAAQVIGGAR